MKKSAISLLSVLMMTSALFSAEMKTIAVSTNLIMGEPTEIEFQASGRMVDVAFKPKDQDRTYRLTITVEETEIEGQVKLITQFSDQVKLGSEFSSSIEFEIEAILTKGDKAVLYRKDADHFTISLK